MTSRRKQLGAQGEKLACHALRKNQYHIIDTNWRCRYGEIDIVAFDTRTRYLVFIEVRTKASTLCGNGFESITYKKRVRLRQLATLWLSCHPCPYPIRIDVIYVDATMPSHMIIHHKKAVI